MARLSTPNMLNFVWSHDPHGPLYYAMLQPMLALGGSEWLLRLPSALMSIASIAVLYALGAELFTRGAGLLAAAIFALSPIQIWYAQEARMYALVVLLTMAAGWFAVRAWRSNHALDWALLAACQGLALLTNTSAIWFTLALNVAALLAIRWLWRSGRFWHWVASQAGAVVLFVPWLPAFVRAIRDGSAGWIPPATFSTLIRTVADLAGSYERPTLEALFVLVVLMAVLAVVARQLLKDARQNRLCYILLVCWLVVPLALAFLLSQPYVRPAFLNQILGPGRSVFLTRNLLIVSGPLYLLIARSLMLSSAWSRRAILVTLVALNGWAYFGNTIPPKKPDFRSAANIAAQGTSAGDVIICSPSYLELPFLYYYGLSNATLPASQDFQNGLITSSPRRIYPDVAQALKASRRAWLVTTDSTFDTDPQGAAALVAAQGTLIQRWNFYGVTISLYDLPGGVA